MTSFKQGDEVFALAGFHLGAYAEYDCLPETGLIAIKPSNMTYEQAATVPVGGLHAFHLLEQANIQSGQRILIIGAGGSVGTIALQLAKSLGAEVTAVDASGKLDSLLSLGADDVIDYSKGDFTQGEKYDVILDVIGKSSFSDCIRSLRENGVLLLGNPGITQALHRFSSKGNKKVIAGASYQRENLVTLKKLIEAEKIASVIDRVYPLEEIVQAHEFVEGEQKFGNVAITIN